MDLSLDDIIAKTGGGNADISSRRRSANRREARGSFGDAEMRSRNSRPSNPRISKENQRGAFGSRPYRPAGRAWGSDSRPAEWNSRESRGSPRGKAWSPRIVKVSNLEYSVMRDDLVEMFTSVGPIERCWVDYDRTDRSEGTGGAIFVHSRDADRAVEVFNGRVIEGQEIHLEITVRPNNTRPSGQRRIEG